MLALNHGTPAMMRLKKAVVSFIFLNLFTGKKILEIFVLIINLSGAKGSRIPRPPLANGASTSNPSGLKAVARLIGCSVSHKNPEILKTLGLACFQLYRV